jgi:hypothetical protein
MAEMDVLADHDAAIAYAALYGSCESRPEFLEMYREALFFSSAYFFKTFTPTADRPDKIARVICVLIMTARLASYDSFTSVNERGLPLDTPLIVKLSSCMKEIAVFQAEPSQRLLWVANDLDGIGELVEDVLIGNLDLALARACALVRVKLVD